MSLTSLAASAALVLTAAGSVPATPPTPPPLIVVQICVAVDLAQVDAILDRLHETDLVGPLEPLAPVTLPDADGLAVAPTKGLQDVRAVLNCGASPTPTTTPAPTTDPVATTDPAPTTAPTTTEPAGTTTIVVPAPQVRTIPVGGVATGDGSLAA